jgi:predicted nucleic acid-binding protein
MSVLTVLIDTDVLIDFLTDRKPFTANAKKLMQKSHEKTMNAFLAAHSVTNIFYILRKHYSVADRKQRLTDLCKAVSVVEIGAELILNALANNDFDDVEDCLQSECATAINADYIVTRNIEDYAGSKVPAVLPEELLNKLTSN